MPLDVGCRSCGTLECVEQCQSPKTLIIPVHNVFCYPEAIGKNVDDLEHLLTLHARDGIDPHYFEEGVEAVSPSLIRPTQEYVTSQGLLYFTDHDEGLPLICRFKDEREWCLMDGHHRAGLHIIMYGRTPMSVRYMIFNQDLIF